MSKWRALASVLLLLVVWTELVVPNYVDTEEWEDVEMPQELSDLAEVAEQDSMRNDVDKFFFMCINNGCTAQGGTCGLNLFRQCRVRNKSLCMGWCNCCIP